MVFPARANRGSTDTAYDVFPISASATNNIFGKAYNATNGGDARACRELLADADMTITCVMASGVTRTNVPVQKGYNPLQVIQVTAISAGGLWGLI